MCKRGVAAWKKLACISTDGRGRWMDNRMIERLWRSLNMNAFISTALRQAQKWRQVLRTGLMTITANALTRPMASWPQMKPMKPYRRSKEQRPKKQPKIHLILSPHMVKKAGPPLYAAVGSVFQTIFPNSTSRIGKYSRPYCELERQTLVVIDWPCGGSKNVWKSESRAKSSSE